MTVGWLITPPTCTQSSKNTGGKYLSRSGNVTVLEGEDRGNTLIAILQFPDAAAVAAFATDPDYAPYAKARQAGGINNFQMIDDTDVAGSISYLTAD